MKTITFKTRLIGKALFSNQLPCNSRALVERKQTKIQDLIGGSVLVFQTLTIKPWAFWIQCWAWHKLSPSLFYIILKRRRATLHQNMPHNRTTSERPGNSNTTCFLFFTWHKSCSCGPMWQFAGDGTYGFNLKMGEREVADIQVVIIKQTGVDRDTELELIQIVPTTLRWWLSHTFKTPTSFSFIYNAELKISPKLFQEDGIADRFEQALPSCTKTYR